MKKKNGGALSEKEEREWMLGVFIAWWKVEGKWTLGDLDNDAYELAVAKFVAEALLAGPNTKLNFRGAINRLRVMCCGEQEDRVTFLKKLGKCLTGEIVPRIADQRDIDIAEVILFHPKLSARLAIAELERRGHRGLTEVNYRMWKMRLTKEWNRMNYRYSRRCKPGIVEELKHNTKSP